MNVPPMEAPASLFVKRGQGRPEPASGVRKGVYHAGPFGDCAFLLAMLLPAEGGDEFWIESTTGRLNADQIKDAFDRGLIERVN